MLKRLHARVPSLLASVLHAARNHLLVRGNACVLHANVTALQEKPARSNPDTVI